MALPIDLFMDKLIELGLSANQGASFIAQGFQDLETLAIVDRAYIAVSGIEWERAVNGSDRPARPLFDRSVQMCSGLIANGL